MKKVNFTKMQSLGNDFIIIDNLVSTYNNFSKKEIKKICDRNYGVGCDQLLILKKSKKRHISFTYKIFMYNYTIFCNKICDNSNYIKELFFNSKIKYNNIQFLS